MPLDKITYVISHQVLAHHNVGNERKML